MNTPPPFEEWSRYCFTLGRADSRDLSMDPVIEARAACYCRLDPEILTKYLTRLFKSSASLADKYSDQQLTDATWFVFGADPEFISTVRLANVPRPLQIECVTSMGMLYTDLFDPRCARRDTLSLRTLNDFDPLESAVFTIWDMGCVELLLYAPDKTPHLVDPALGVLETVLTKCRSAACIASALHAIGHIRMIDNPDQDPIGRSAGALLDALVATRPLPAPLLEYAAAARTGNIQ